MESQAHAIRSAVERHRSGRSGRGLRYPRVLQEQAVSYARAARGRGASAWAISRELGIGVGALQRWLGRADRAERPALRRVEVTAEEISRESSSGSGPVLVLASGVRVEGLSLEQLVVLVRALG